MPDVNTSSYPTVAPYQPPQGNNALQMYSGAVDIGNKLLQQKQQTLGIQQQQLELANKHIEAMQGYLAPLIAKPDVSTKDIISAAGTLISEGRATPQEVAAEFSSMPSGEGGSQPSTQQLKGWLQGYLIKSLDAQSRLNAVAGVPTVTNLGDRVNVSAISPLTGIHSLGDMKPGLPPTTTKYNPATKQMEYVGGPGANDLPPGTAKPISAGDLTAPQPKGGIPSAPPLGASTAADVSAQSNADQAMSLQKSASTVPQQKALLGNMESKLDDFTSGPGAETWKNIAAGVQRIYGGQSQGVASNEDFNKMAAMIAQTQFQALGGTGTDAKLDSAVHTSPNDFLSKRGNKEIIHLLKGNADAISVMNDEWQKAQQKGMGPEDYGRFVNQFNKTYDPRAFQLQYMTPKERSSILGGMSDAEKTRFRGAVNMAVENQWIPDPRAGNGK